MHHNISTWLSPKIVKGQYEEDEDDGEEADSESEVVSSTTKKIDPLLNMTFTEQFQALVAQADIAAANKSSAVTSTPATSKSNSTINSNATTVATPTTPKTRQKTTTVPNRGAEIGSSVNGILSSVGILDIPGIVDNALSISDDSEVRDYVGGLLKSIFCAPILNNFSRCNQRPNLASQILDSAKKGGIATTTAPKWRQKQLHNKEFVYDFPSPRLKIKWFNVAE